MSLGRWSKNETRRDWQQGSHRDDQLSVHAELGAEERPSTSSPVAAFSYKCQTYSGAVPVVWQAYARQGPSTTSHVSQEPWPHNGGDPSLSSKGQ